VVEGRAWIGARKTQLGDIRLCRRIQEPMVKARAIRTGTKFKGLGVGHHKGGQKNNRRASYVRKCL